jgi:hypothetical protein
MLSSIPTKGLRLTCRIVRYVFDLKNYQSNEMLKRCKDLIKSLQTGMIPISVEPDYVIKHNQNILQSPSLYLLYLLTLASVYTLGVCCSCNALMRYIKPEVL